MVDLCITWKSVLTGSTTSEKSHPGEVQPRGAAHPTSGMRGWVCYHAAAHPASGSNSRKKPGGRAASCR